MRKLLIYSLLALFVCTMGSCSKEEVFYEFAENEIAATFSASKLNYNDLTDADNGKISVPLYRGNTKGDASVAVEIEGGEGIFTPSATSFNFKDGENVAYIDFTFDYATLSAKPTTISVSITDEKACSVNSIPSTKFTLTRQLTWELVGEGLYYCGLFGESWPQDVYKAEEGDFYMLPDCWVGGTSFTFFCDGETIDWYPFETGYNYGSYGQFAFEVLDKSVISLEGTPAIKIDCNYRLPSYYNYLFDTAYELFMFPEGFQF